MSQERKAIDAAAVALMLGLTALWGFQQVTIKVIAADVSFVMQAAIRSLLATLLLLAWSRLTKESLWGRDGTLAAGLGAGLLFAIEFVFIYGGLGYTMPRAWRCSCISRRRSPRSGALAFGGLVAAVLWASTAVLIRASRLAARPRRFSTSSPSRRWCFQSVRFSWEKPASPPSLRSCWRASPTRASSWPSAAISSGSRC